MEATATVIVNGTVYSVLDETMPGPLGAQLDPRPMLAIRRPKGHKVFFARRLPDSPLYGQNRAVIVCAFPATAAPSLCVEA